MLVGNPVGALIVDVALLLIRKMALWRGAVKVGAALSTDQVLLDADAQVPVRAGDVHQPGQSIVPRHVLHL